MDAGGLEPEPSAPDVDAQELPAAFTVFQRALWPGKGRGEGGGPRPRTPPARPRARAARRGGPFQGR
eukprot:7522287-Alexandrium_andersonii.AAC.1